jgi:hypothetical protein
MGMSGQDEMPMDLNRTAADAILAAAADAVAATDREGVSGADFVIAETGDLQARELLKRPRNWKAS